MARLPPAPIVSMMNGFRHKLGQAQQKLVPPSIAALDFVTGMWNFQIVYTLCELGILDRLGDAPTSSGTIAAAIKAPEDRIYRLLRAASMIGLVTETPKRSFSLTAIGKALQTDSLGSMRDFIVFQGRVGFKSWGVLKDVVVSGKSALELLYNQTTFDFFSDPEVSDTFNKAMTGISAMATDAVLASYSFKEAKTIADIGGGHGRLLGSILRDYPGAQGVLLDLPAVVAGAPHVLDELGVAQRCRVLGASFFEPLPDFDADVIVMKNIIHDWPDEDAFKILKNVKARMKSGTRLVLCEVVVPPPNSPSFAKHLDLEIMVHAHGRERTEAEYGALFAQVGLKLNRVIPTPGPMSLVEAQ